MKNIDEKILMAEEEIKQLQNKRKKLISKQKQEERKKRDRRLYEKGGVFESIFNESKDFTKDEFYQLITFQNIKEIINQKILKIMEKRKKMISSDLDDAAQTKAEAEEIKQEYEKNLAQAKDEAGQIVSDARARAKNEYQNKMDQTKEEIALMKENARKDIEAEKQKTIAGLQTEIAGIALMAASKVVEKEANDKGNEKLLDDFLKEAGV